jgi:hypothetical protein
VRPGADVSVGAKAETASCLGSKLAASYPVRKAFCGVGKATRARRDAWPSSSTIGVAVLHLLSYLQAGSPSPAVGTSVLLVLTAI